LASPEAGEVEPGHTFHRWTSQRETPQVQQYRSAGLQGWPLSPSCRHLLRRGPCVSPWLTIPMTLLDHPYRARRQVLPGHRRSRSVIYGALDDRVVTRRSVNGGIGLSQSKGRESATNFPAAFREENDIDISHCCSCLTTKGGLFYRQ